MEKLTISIGMPAYNEENNIHKLLSSIVQQKEDGFVINKIILLIDGATDRTEEFAGKIKDKRIMVVSDKKRLGKTARINQLFNLLEDDVLVLLDADITLKTSESIKKLVEPFNDKTTGLVGGRVIPENNKKFIEKAICLTLNVYEKYLKTIRNGNNIFAVKGAIMAVSKELAKKTKIPSDVFANDAYLYFSCIQHRLKFRYAYEATAWYKIPSTIKDQIAQNTRFEGSENNLTKYFGDLVNKEYAKNNKVFYQLQLEALLKHPILSLTIFGINLYTKLVAVKYAKENKATWVSVKTTK